MRRLRTGLWERCAAWKRERAAFKTAQGMGVWDAQVQEVFRMLASRRCAVVRRANLAGRPPAHSSTITIQYRFRPCNASHMQTTRRTSRCKVPNNATQETQPRSTWQRLTWLPCSDSRLALAPRGPGRPQALLSAMLRPGSSACGLSQSRHPRRNPAPTPAVEVLPVDVLAIRQAPLFHETLVRRAPQPFFVTGGPARAPRE